MMFKPFESQSLLDTVKEILESPQPAEE